MFKYSEERYYGKVSAKKKGKNVKVKMVVKLETMDQRQTGGGAVVAPNDDLKGLARCLGSKAKEFRGGTVGRRTPKTEL